ncbi:MAG: hypothetical protein ACRCTD_15710 [Beijerinckiaceae bacterium]
MKPVIRFAINFAVPWLIIVIVALGVYRDWNLRSMPASDWMDVHKVVVSDTIEGAAPLIFVERTIRRQFAARWTASVKELTPTGTIGVAGCASAGSGNYEPTSELPSPLTIDWWLYPEKCRPPPGRYVLVTKWKIDLAGDLDKTITTTSSSFQVFSAGSDQAGDKPPV